MVYALIEQPSPRINLTAQGGPVTASQVYGLGVNIYELALKSLKFMEENCRQRNIVKMVQAYTRDLNTEKQELTDNYKFSLNHEISLFYQNKGLFLSEAGKINEDEFEAIIYPILAFYSAKLDQLEEIVSLMDIDNQNEVLMICLELTDTLYSVFRQLSHLYPIADLRPFFKEMGENASKLYS